MLNLNEIIENIDAAKTELSSIQDLNKLQDFELRILREHLEKIRVAVSAEIGRKAAVASGTGNAYKVFLRIIKGIDNRPALKGAFYTKQDHFLSVCDGFHAIRMFRDDFNPPMVPENLEPIDLDKVYNGIDKTVDTRKRIPLPSLQELRAFAKMETAARRAIVPKKYDTWIPRYAIKHDSESFGCVIRCYDVKLLLDILEAIPDAYAYAAASDGPYSLLYFRGTDGDAILLPLRMTDEEKREDLIKSEALLGGSYFTSSARREGAA